jgi:hypothetical protein
MPVDLRSFAWPVPLFAMLAGCGARSARDREAARRRLLAAGQRTDLRRLPHDQLRARNDLLLHRREHDGRGVRPLLLHRRRLRLGGKCDTGGVMPYFAPDAPNLGVCVLTSPPDGGATGEFVCNPPPMAPSMGSCVIIM